MRRALSLFCVVLTAVHAVDRSKFRTCETAAFCNRHRSKAAEPEVREAPNPPRWPFPGRSLCVCVRE
jgi:hypothetical protein